MTVVTRSLTDTDRFLFDLRGYIVLKGILAREHVRSLNEAIDARGFDAMDEEGRGRIVSVIDWGRSFTDLIDHEAVLPYLTEWVDASVRLDNAYPISLVPGDRGLPLHGGIQDGRTPWVPSTTTWYTTDRGRIRSGLTKVCWALTDVAPGSGAFCCVPGSHRGSFPPPTADCAAAVAAGHAVEVAVEAGDAVIFTEALVHGSLDRTGPGSRRVLVYKYLPGFACYLSRAWPDDERLSLTDRQRAVLDGPYVRDARQERRRPVG